MIEELKRRLNRLNNRVEAMEEKHLGSELKLTYWAGYNLGYLKGKIWEIENTLDLLENKED